MPLLPLLLLLPADIAVRDDGKRLDGELRLSKTGRLVFTPARRDGSADDIVEYRFAPTAAPFRAAPGMLMSLAGGQRLTGVLLGVEKDRVRFRTAWGERLDLPRDAVVSLTHLPGRRPVFHDDLTGKPDAWSVRGEPKNDDASLVLNRAGQSLSCSPARPVDEGHLGVNVREQGSPGGARWMVEAVFALKKGERVVRVVAGEGESWSVTTGGLKGTPRDVARSNAVRRLFVDFTAGSLRIALDDEPLWHTLDEGPGGPLKSVRLACVDRDRPEKATGAVAFSQFSLDRAVPESRHPPGDPRRDKLWLADGDQLFGEVVRADARAVEIKGRFGSKRYPWADLRGWFPRRGGQPPAAKAPVVRLGVRGGLRNEDDELEGTLTALEAKSVTIRHPSLGELILPRERVAWLRPRAGR